ncbi:hypothetical protein [Paraflavitalea speifideaquila]|uniref:hypothetical protein n=1 Tax=Paraflavitalea speifideaquila TaxID=3076558 RepID=UPI0028E9F42B|nr:hypothetical protein [Paraflavitalea speifideiaquila]
MLGGIGQPSVPKDLTVKTPDQVKLNKTGGYSLAAGFKTTPVNQRNHFNSSMSDSIPEIP